MTTPKMIVLQLEDNKQFNVEYNAIQMSILIKDMIEHNIEDEHVQIVPIPCMDEETLIHIIEYINFHWNNRAEKIPKPLEQNLSTYLSEWDKQYLNTKLLKNGDEKHHELLLKVIKGAHFLKIDDLLQLTCACHASMMINKTPEQIRALFNLPDDLTEEKKAKQIELNKTACTDMRMDLNTKQPTIST